MKIRLTYGVTLLFLIWSFVSCGPRMRPIELGLKSPAIIQPPVNIVKHDTVFMQPKKMTSKELQEYLLPFYKANYDNLFAPEFKKMGATISVLAGDNERLTGLVLAMRTRSIVKNDSNMRVNQKKDSEILKLRRIAVDQNKQLAIQNQLQIFKLNNVTDILLVAWGTMFAALITLAFFVYLLWRRIKSLSNSLYNV